MVYPPPPEKQHNNLNMKWNEIKIVLYGNDRLANKGLTPPLSKWWDKKKKKDQNRAKKPARYYASKGKRARPFSTHKGGGSKRILKKKVQWNQNRSTLIPSRKVIIFEPPPPPLKLLFPRERVEIFSSPAHQACWNWARPTPLSYSNALAFC